MFIFIRHVFTIQPHLEIITLSFHCLYRACDHLWLNDPVYCESYIRLAYVNPSPISLKLPNNVGGIPSHSLYLYDVAHATLFHGFLFFENLVFMGTRDIVKMAGKYPMVVLTDGSDVVSDEARLLDSYFVF